MTRILGSLWMLALLCGCQSSVSAYVTRFNSLNGPATGQTFTILPESDQAGSLEFQHVAVLVADALAAQGFQPVPHDGSPADYAVFLRYGSAGARTQIYDWGPGWGPGWRHWGPAPYPTYEAYTLYSQFLEVTMLDGPTWRRGERQTAFQGRAIADTGVREINVVVAYLVRALFDHFPGANGQTVRVTVPVT